MKEKTLDWRKVLSLLLIVALVLQISPVQAFAVGQDESVIEQTETIAAATEDAAPEATVIGGQTRRRCKAFSKLRRQLHSGKIRRACALPSDG